MARSIEVLRTILPVLLALVFRHFANLNLIWLAFVMAEAIGIPAAMMLWRSGSGATLTGLPETA